MGADEALVVDFCMYWGKDPYMAMKRFPVYFWRRYPPCVEDMFCSMLKECIVARDVAGCYYEVVYYAKRIGINSGSIYCFNIFYYAYVSKGSKAVRMSPVIAGPPNPQIHGNFRFLG